MSSDEEASVTDGPLPVTIKQWPAPLSIQGFLDTKEGADWALWVCSVMAQARAQRGVLPDGEWGGVAERLLLEVLPEEYRTPEFTSQLSQVAAQNEAHRTMKLIREWLGVSAEAFKFFQGMDPEQRKMSFEVVYIARSTDPDPDDIEAMFGEGDLDLAAALAESAHRHYWLRVACLAGAATGATVAALRLWQRQRQLLRK